MTHPDLAAARAFQDELRAAMAKVPPYIHQSDKAAWTAAVDALTALIVSKGGKVRKDWQGASVRLYGIHAKSTSSVTRACENWIRQLTLKSMAENMGGGAG